MITSNRLEEFVRAELTFFAERSDRPLQPLRLREILRASSAPPQVAKLLHEELPVRFARRIRNIERIPGWEAIPELAELHVMHAKSFRELRLADPTDSSEYPRVVGRIRQRHKRISSLFAEALKRIGCLLQGVPSSAGAVNGSPQEANDEVLLDRRGVEQWAEAFLSSRVSTEMQMAHYAACLQGEGSGNSSRIGILDVQCDPVDVCRQAIAEVQDGPFACLVKTENICGKLQFCLAPRYLFYIMKELLDNSVRATAGLAQTPEELDKRPVTVTVCANDFEVVIRVSDQGGGMPVTSPEQIWSFVPTVMRSRRGICEDQVSLSAGLSSQPRWDEDKATQVGAASSAYEAADVLTPWAPPRPWGVFAGQSPLSGKGIGLPLSRLYARYLGGSLEVINMPGLGVDAYLFLARIDPFETSLNLP